VIRLRRQFVPSGGGTTGERRKMHWTKKDKLFKSKHVGGMGFKTLRDFNLAMLVKKV
jgi:hypothetical protein